MPPSPPNLIDPGEYLDGRVTLDRDAGVAAIERFGTALGWGLERRGSKRSSSWPTTNMAGALRSVTIQRGQDPRDCTMFAYGGTLPLFAAAICERLDVRKVVVPANSSVFSAFGLLLAKFLRRYSRSVDVSLADPSVPDVVAAIREDMTRVALDEATAGGMPEADCRLEWGADLRFMGQTFEIGVPLWSGPLTADDARELWASGFPARYESAYGKGTAWEGSPVMLLNLSLTVVADRPMPDIPTLPLGDEDPVCHGEGPAPGADARRVVGGRRSGLRRRGVPERNGRGRTGSGRRARHDAVHPARLAWPAGRVDQLHPGAEHLMATYDVLRAEVHRKAMDEIAREMGITLVRTSGSPVVTEAKDLSCSVLDDQVEQIGFSSYVGLHISTSFLGVEAVTRNYTPDEIAPGDAFLVNDPHSSGALHQGDIGVVMPYFYDRRVRRLGLRQRAHDRRGRLRSCRHCAAGARDVFLGRPALPGDPFHAGWRAQPRVASLHRAERARSVQRS